MMVKRPTGIPLLLVATKHDLLQANAAPEVQDVVGRALRALAHTHAATLVVLGEQQGPAQKGPRGGAMDRFKAILRGHLFHGWDVDLRCGAHTLLYHTYTNWTYTARRSRRHSVTASRPCWYRWAATAWQTSARRPVGQGLLGGCRQWWRCVAPLHRLPLLQLWTGRCMPSPVRVSFSCVRLPVCGSLCAASTNKHITEVDEALVRMAAV